MAANFTKLKKKLVPPPDGQDVARLRTAVVSAMAADGTVDITLNGATIPDVPVLGGAVFVVGQSVQLLSYRGSMLVLGGSGLPAAQPQAASGTTAQGTTTSTSFTNTLTSTGIHGVVFIAPPSGTVTVIGRSSTFNTTSGAYTLLDFQINTGAVVGSGTIFRGSQEALAGVHQSTIASGEGTIVTTDIVTGLTPGAVYNACLTYHASPNGTASFNRRHIMVLPR